MQAMVPRWGEYFIHTEICRSKLENIDYKYFILKVDDTLMCTGLKEGGKDACKGDSGGALLHREGLTGSWVAVGIISAGYKCGHPRVPGIYSRVAKFSSWVEEQVP